MKMFYPLLESPDGIKIYHPYEKIYASCLDSDSIAFGIYEGKLYCSKLSKTHSEIFDQNTMRRIKNEKKVISYRHIWDFPGRIWTDKKIISFWIYPNKDKFYEIILDLEKELNLSIWDDDEFRVEINQILDQENFRPDSFRNEWTIYNKKSSAIIPLKDYTNSKDASPKKFNTPHQPPKSTDGYGSKHPKYQDRQKEKRFMTAESYYPQLNESPDFVNYNKKLYLDDGKVFPFATKDEEGIDLIVGEMGATHDDNNTIGFNDGRIWVDEKIISFWSRPPKHVVENILFELEHYFNTYGTDLVHIEEVEDFVIELPIKNDWYYLKNPNGEYFTLSTYPDEKQKKLQRIYLNLIILTLL